MFVNHFALVLVSNPFYQAFIQSDYLGKMIFLALVATSICSWTVLIQKMIYTREIKQNSQLFSKTFSKYRKTPLNVEEEEAFQKKNPSPFLDLYLILKRYTVDILNKNRTFGGSSMEASYLSSSDIESIASHLNTTVDVETKNMEKYLFVLSTVVGLAPLLGLLGTVWGILITFTDLQSHAAASSNQAVLGGISLALTTTVMGLMNAIPALIAYNGLKNSIRNFQIEMESFSSEMLSCVEMQYRKVDIT